MTSPVGTIILMCFIYRTKVQIQNGVNNPLVCLKGRPVLQIRPSTFALLLASKSKQTLSGDHLNTQNFIS